jgi:hypothetical protein
MTSNPMDLQDLRLGSREIENLSGLEVSDRWIGGIIGGVYRFSRLRRLADWLNWLLFEGIAAALLFVFTLPIGLALSRLGASEAQGTVILLAGMGFSTLIGMLVWNGYMLRQRRSLRSFMHLLDEIDRYHDVLDAVAVLEQLRSVQDRPQSSTPNCLETLQITRDCFIAGLKTERILRSPLGRRSQTEAGLLQLEHNFVTLQSLAVQDQADEYSTLLAQALQIGQSVREELAKSSVN